MLPIFNIGGDKSMLAQSSSPVILQKYLDEKAHFGGGGVSGPCGHPIQGCSPPSLAPLVSSGKLKQRKACPEHPLPPQWAVQAPQLIVEDVRTLRKVRETLGRVPLREVILVPCFLLGVVQLLALNGGSVWVGSILIWTIR